MDEMEWTKIAGAVLTALLLIFGSRTVFDMASKSHNEKPGYVLFDKPSGNKKEAAAGAKPSDAKPSEAKTGEAKAAAAAPEQKSGGDEAIALLGKASADNGKTIFSKCKSCHMVEKGKASTVGPNLWGIVNRPKASYEGYTYSESLKGKGGNWSFDDLSAFIANPKAYASGTKMGFAGLADAGERADVLAYLATLADAPVPLTK